jgi:hypothetical protein
MPAQIAAKITAFAVAVMLNGLMVLGIGYLCSEQSQVRAQATAGSIAQLPSEPDAAASRRPAQMSWATQS